MEIRVNKPFDPANSLADLRVIYRSSLAGARSFAIAAVAVGSGGAALVLISDRMRLLRSSRCSWPPTACTSAWAPVGRCAAP
ncbi:hypothetical protein ACFQX7_21010 [Luedemannella flava]